MAHQAPPRARRRLVVTAVFVLLVAGWGIGIWATMLRGTVQEITGTFVARPTETIILIRHDAIPWLGMQPMELMAVEVDARELVDRAGLEPGDRVRLTVRQRPDRLLALTITRLR
jgi:Copper binding periplasmic protein CusF